jgi:hypothetical protein
MDFKLATRAFAAFCPSAKSRIWVLSVASSDFSNSFSALRLVFSVVRLVIKASLSAIAFAKY